jgi:hypothetical protein
VRGLTLLVAHPTAPFAPIAGFFDEYKCRFTSVDAELRNLKRSLPDEWCLQIERDKKRSRLYKLICRKNEHIPEPTQEDTAYGIGREEPKV